MCHHCQNHVLKVQYFVDLLLFQGCWSRWERIYVMFLRNPIGQNFHAPNRRLNRCQEWRRCVRLQKRERLRYDQFQDCWSSRVSFDSGCLRYPIGHSFHVPNRRQNRHQELRRCASLQKRERLQYDPCQGCLSRWVSFDQLCLRCPVGQ